MPLKRDKFYEQIRITLFTGKLTKGQVEGMEAILNEWERQKLKDLRWLAYMLGTAFHEVAKTMQPIEEYGHGATRPYGKKIKCSGVKYQLPDKIYYGRGLVQLTWYENYELMGRLLKVDLLKNPERACELEVAVKVMFEGMLRGSSSVGDFTGKCLEMYFNDTNEDWINARRIINGLDKATLIGFYSKQFHNALRSAA